MRNLLSAFAIIGFGCILSLLIATSKPKPEKNTLTNKKPLTVNVIQARQQSQAIVVQTFGVIQAKQSIRLLSEVSGQVNSISSDFIKGGYINKGERLLTINPIHYQTALAQAQATLKKALEEAAREKARSNQARKEWRDLGSKSANDLFLRKPQLDSVEAQVNAAKAQVSQAQYNLDQTAITLDFDAVIVEPYVQRDQFVAVGTNLADLYARNEMQVTLPITQAQLKRLNLTWPIDSAAELPDIHLTATMGQHTFALKGRIRHTGATIDDANQLISFIVDINDPAARPGLYVDAEITGKNIAGILQVPHDALFDHRFILVVDNDDRIDFRSAEVFGHKGNTLYVKADVADGEWIVTERLPQPFIGMTVAPQPIDGQPILSDTTKH